MTRPLQVVDASDPAAVDVALRDALSGDGPAIMPSLATPGGIPAEVAQRVALVVETSGSTGRPKRVALSSDAILASAAAAQGILGAPGQWLLALPLTYIAGLNVVARARASATGFVVIGPGPFTVEAFCEAANRMDAATRYTSLVPTQLARLVDDDSALETVRRFDRILIGGQAAPVELIARALELGLNVTRTYGSSETCGGCVWDGVPIGNTEARIVNGRVELTGDVLAEGYLDDVRRNAFSFREHDGKRWYRTDDAGELVDGVLRVSGRLDDQIISGGVKVSIAEVELAVRALPGLAHAVVVASPHPEWGETPVVISTVGMPLDELRAAVAAVLGPAAAPSRILLIDVLPMLASGKPDRLSLAALALG